MVIEHANEEFEHEFGLLGVSRVVWDFYTRFNHHLRLNQFLEPVIDQSGRKARMPNDNQLKASKDVSEKGLKPLKR